MNQKSDWKNELDFFISNAIREDVGEGDHTSLACIPGGEVSAAELIIKEKGILAGVELAFEIFRQIDSELIIENYKKDGDVISEGDIALAVKGNSRSILKAERLVLNCMQRMSGIATKTKVYVDLVTPYNCRILDTRKTTPGFREVEKWAVRIGGGTNHRFGLYDMIMIKDNHIDYAGGIRPAIEKTNKYLAEIKKDLKIEIEARNLEEVDEILKVGGIHRIMLDNFHLNELREAVKRISSRYETEASGGINEKTVAGYAACGVDFISVGALTHQINSLDMSLKARTK